MDRRAHAPARVIGRYAIFDAIASGGMATVHFGRLLGPSGFSRTVAVKRLHAQYAAMPDVAAMFLDEARVAARLRHPNVVGILDMIAEGSEVLLVMDYVHGESLAYLLRNDTVRDPRRVLRIANVVAGALHGLHAAHEAKGEDQRPLGVVHRDFSPQNVLVGVDGTARVLDFGVAKAAGQRHHSGDGEVKGKVRYLSPEQVRCGTLDRRADLWAASIVLWEALTGRRLFSADDVSVVLAQVLDQPIPSPRDIAPEVPERLARVVMRGLERDPEKRFATAVEMAAAIEDAVGLITPREVGAWVERVARGRLDERRRALAAIEAEDVAELTAPEFHRAMAFAGNTDHNMVRTSLEELVTVPMAPPRPQRARAIAWGASAAAVAAIAAGVGVRLAVGAGPALGAPPGGPVPAALLAVAPDSAAREAAGDATAVPEDTPLPEAVDPPSTPPPAPEPSTHAPSLRRHRPGWFAKSPAR